MSIDPRRITRIERRLDDIDKWKRYVEKPVSRLVQDQRYRDRILDERNTRLRGWNRKGAIIVAALVVVGSLERTLVWAIHLF